MLYSADIRQEDLRQLWQQEAQRAENEPQRQASWEYATLLINTYLDSQPQIDELIAQHSHNWTLEKMPAVDRAILRMATAEILRAEVPAAAVINEAVKLAKDYSTEKSSAFVNGVLAGVANRE